MGVSDRWRPNHRTHVNKYGGRHTRPCDPATNVQMQRGSSHLWLSLSDSGPLGQIVSLPCGNSLISEYLDQI